MITPERHKQINEICDAMMQLPSSQRSAFLAQACDGDEELRREVESLLAYEEDAATFIEKPAIDALAKKLAQEQTRTGRQISHFQILAPLGKGGMGEVYLALDQRLGRKVAIKLLLPEFTSNKTLVERFDQEARAASALNHPNIITVYEIDEVDGLHFIATELVEGQTLRQLMNDQPVEPGTALELATQIASALQAAHNAHLIHRDIKPENIMVRTDGLVKVLDFGLAKLSRLQIADCRLRIEEGEALQQAEPDDPQSAISNQQSTLPGAVMGTPRYMSPEQARGENVDARTDIFSLGVVLYEMLAGRPPFEGASAPDVIGAILHQEPPPLPPEAPDELQRIVFQCLHKNREARYSSARELVNELHRLRELITSESVAPAQGRRRQGLTRRQLILSLAAVLVLLAALGYALITRRTPGAQTQIKSLAVLPLKPISEGSEQNYLGLGIADTIITKISRINGLVVRPTSAVRRYASQETDALQAAREQRVDAVLDGTIQREDDRLRVSVNLLRTDDGASLWTDQFDLNFTEIFGLQDKVARQVVERLRYRLSPAEQTRIARQHTTNPLAYEYYTKATYYFGDRKMFWWQREGTDKAVELLRKAVELDPNYALAHVMLAYSYAHTAIMHEENPDLIRRANLELEQAEKLDPQLAEIRVVRSFIRFSHYQGYQVEETLAELRQAQQLDPNAGHFELAFLYAHLGLEQWQGELERALELEPASEVIKDHIIRFYFMDQPEEALAAIKRFALSERDPAYSMYLALYYMGKMMPKEAAPFIAEVTRKNPDWYNFRGLSLARQGNIREAEVTVSEGWEKTKTPPVCHPVYHHFTHNAARIYALAGKSEEAVRWLRVTAQEGFPNYPLFQRDPYLDGIRTHPAFAQFMVELKTQWEGYRRAIE